MTKYLIQDIIPPDRKNSVKKTNVKVTHHKPHDEKIEQKTTHSTTVHSTHKITHNATKEEEIIDENVTNTASEDPKKMIFNQMSEAPQPKLEHEITEDPVTDNFFSTAEDVNPPSTSWLERNQKKPDISTIGSTTANYYMKKPTTSSLGFSLKSWLPWVVGVSAISLLAFLVMNFFSGATITVTPKRESIPMSQKITILKKPLNGELSYSVMKLTLEETREVPATGEKSVTSKANGKIIIYNTQSVSQRLIKNTRFQSPSGKIYRINESITIPKSTTSGGKITPGSLEVTVYADEAGPSYNSEPVDFTVPGLKGSTIFEKVYARSKGPLSGGESGTIKSVSDLDLKQASDDLRIQLETKLRSKSRSDLAQTQIGYDAGVIVELEEAQLSTVQASSVDKAVVSQKGTLYFLTFDKNELTNAIVHSLIPTYKGEGVLIENLGSLTLDIKKSDGETLWSSESLEIGLSGTPYLEWEVNESQIKEAILGKPKDNFNAILSQFTTIDRATAKVHPIWKQTFPDDVKDISFKIVMGD